MFARGSLCQPFTNLPLNDYATHCDRVTYTDRRPQATQPHTEDTLQHIGRFLLYIRTYSMHSTTRTAAFGMQTGSDRVYPLSSIDLRTANRVGEPKVGTRNWE